MKKYLFIILFILFMVLNSSVYSMLEIISHSKTDVEGFLKDIDSNVESIQKEAIKGLSSLMTEEARNVAREGISKLLVMVNDNDFMYRLQAAEALGNIGLSMDEYRTIKPVLLEDVKSESMNRRKLALDCLASLRQTDAESTIVILTALKDSSLDVRDAAVAALAYLNPDIEHLENSVDYIQILISLMKEKEDFEKVVVIGALDNFGEDASLAVESIIEALNDSFEAYVPLDDAGVTYFPVREAACQALKKIGTPKALEAVKEFELKRGY